jgi:hypothetical protein
MTDKYQDVCAICAETTPDEAKELVEGILKFETPDLWENSALTRERFIESQMTMWLTGQLIGTDEERDAECRIMRILNARKDEDYEARRKAQETGTGSLQCCAARSRRTSGAAGAKKPEKIKG